MSGQNKKPHGIQDEDKQNRSSITAPKDRAPARPKQKRKTDGGKPDASGPEPLRLKDTGRKNGPPDHDTLNDNFGTQLITSIVLTIVFFTAAVIWCCSAILGRGNSGDPIDSVKRFIYGISGAIWPAADLLFIWFGVRQILKMKKKPVPISTELPLYAFVLLLFACVEIGLIPAIEEWAVAAGGFVSPSLGYMSFLSRAYAYQGGAGVLGAMIAYPLYIRLGRVLAEILMISAMLVCLAVSGVPQRFYKYWIAKCIPKDKLPNGGLKLLINRVKSRILPEKEKDGSMDKKGNITRERKAKAHESVDRLTREGVLKRISNQGRDKEQIRPVIIPDRNREVPLDIQENPLMGRYGVLHSNRIVEKTNDEFRDPRQRKENNRESKREKIRYDRLRRSGLLEIFREGTSSDDPYDAYPEKYSGSADSRVRHISGELPQRPENTREVFRGRNEQKQTDGVSEPYYSTESGEPGSKPVSNEDEYENFFDVGPSSNSNTSPVYSTGEAGTDASDTGDFEFSRPCGQSSAEAPQTNGNDPQPKPDEESEDSLGYDEELMRQMFSNGKESSSEEVPEEEETGDDIDIDEELRKAELQWKAGTGGTEPQKPSKPENEPRPAASRKSDTDGDDSQWQNPVLDDETEQPIPYNYPPIDLLELGEQTDLSQQRQAEDREKANLLIQTLQEFGIETKLQGISHGPAVTRFELTPAVGVKVSKITALNDDIALRLAATSIRIEAPIPGKPAVGIEIPNNKVEMVHLRDVLVSPEALKSPSKIAVGLGKDNSGRYVVADIAKMPHVLIAGQTGSGKSVCINSIITSILYRASPEEVRLLLIDPKVVELSVYNDVPHLIVPVVTDPKKASSALQWAVAEMLDRYKRLHDHNVRDIKSYNKSLKPGEKIMPQMVIIIDELADLMMAANGADVEDAICRLAQLSRAAGIHLVVATQRPSVNVITGVIKANIPTRIAFRVASGVDSRTILEYGGAEKLLGNGDMLYAGNGSIQYVRVQGSWVSDDEVNSIVDYIKNSSEATYDEDVMERIENSVRSDAEKEEIAEEYDPKLPEAVEIVVDAGQASVSMLQRRMRVGYARAGRLIDEMEKRGVISEADGAKPRNVLINREQMRRMFEENGMHPEEE